MHPSDLNLCPETSACFTGHRPNRLKNLRMDDLRLDLQTRIAEAIENGYDTFYCGMAEGIDIIAGELTFSLSLYYPWIKLIAVVPFPGQTQDWTEEWKHRYETLLYKSTRQEILLPQRTKGGYYYRDRYMVDRSSLLIGVYSGVKQGGTAYTVAYANQKGLQTSLLRPQDYRKR